MPQIIVVPLVSKNICLEFKTKHEELRIVEAADYRHFAKNALGPIKVTSYKIQLSDPLNITMDKVAVSKKEWQQLSLENKFLISHITATIALIDTSHASVIFQLQNFKSHSIEDCEKYAKLRSDQASLEKAKLNLTDRKVIHEAMLDLELKEIRHEDAISFVLTDH